MSKFYYPRCYVVLRAIFENFGEAGDIQSFGAIPLSVSIRRNSYNQADSWSIELDAKDFPIPPSMIRSAAVEIRLFDQQGNAPINDSVMRQTPVITGIVDEVDVNWSDSGRVLRLDGQDYTALFMEHQFRENQREAGIKKGTDNRYLHQVIHDMMRQVDKKGAMTMRVDDKAYFPGRQPEKSFGTPLFGGSATKTNRSGFPVKRGDNYWDVMYKLAIKHGYIIFVNNNELVLTTPQFIYRTTPQSALFALKWGENIEELSMSRRMGKERVPQIEVRSYDDDKNEVTVVRFPETYQKVSTGIGTKRNEVQIYTVHGIKDKKELLRYAEAAYNLRARSEQQINLSTKDMKDSLGHDLIQLSTGDALRLEFQPFNTEFLETLPEGSRAQWLTDRGFTPNAAQVIASNYASLDVFRKPFYVKEAEIDWDHDAGFSLSATLINFVSTSGIQEEGEVRDGVSET